MPTHDITTLTAGLRALGGHRVWSLMISLFGDLAQGKGDKIDGPVLSVIMTALEIKPEAARVALHRLRNDGWITSTKSGRISRHSLSEKGRKESAEASPRIYAAPDEGTEAWQLIMLREARQADPEDLSRAGFIKLTARVYVGPQDVEAPVGALALNGTNATDWLREDVAPTSHREAYEDLLRALIDLAQALPEPDKLSPLEVAVLRCAVVHNWRRLVLKHPQPPRDLIQGTSAHHQCHILVADILQRFPRPALSAIGQGRAAA